MDTDKQKKKERKKSDGMGDSLEYKKLLEDLIRIIEAARAKGVDFGGRDDILECKSCGAYEDILADGTWEVRTKDRQLTEHERFILIDCNERVTSRKNMTCCRMTYNFICPECGLMQSETVKVEFEE